MSRQMIAKWMRDALPHKCVNCGSDRGLVYHHIVPVSNGGNDVISNIAVLCTVCHSKVHYTESHMIDHGELVREGIAKARERGIRVGRKPADHERIMKLIAENSTQFNMDSLVTEHEIMEMAGVGMSCYSKCKRQLYKAMKSGEWPYDWAKPVRVRNYPLYDHVIRDMRGDA